MDRRKNSESRCRTNNRLWTSSVFAYVFCVVMCCVALTQQCAIGLKTPGRTIPSGDIILEHGKSLRIYCMLNQSYVDASSPRKNSSDLVFFKGYRQIDPDYVSVVNETTIRLDVAKPPPENAMYYCKLKVDRKLHYKDYEAVCLNKVVVGVKPQEPNNFSCVSHNWENMTCSWEPPFNYIDTSYSITFKLPGRAGGRKQYPCPTDVEKTQAANKTISDPREMKEQPKNSCFWDSTTNPLYRQPYEHYTFIVTGENILGNWSGSYRFHHFANVIPAPATNLTVVNKTQDSALLQWCISFPMQTFPPGLYHRITYQSQWDSRDEWQIIDITDEPHKSPRQYNLTNLKYANTIYDVRVYMKSSMAISDDKWSNYSDVTFRTPARVPGQSPRTDIGSFEITENNINRDIYLYWQSIPSWLENGNNFAYQVSVVEENGRRIFLTPNETTQTYAKFRGLNLHSSYRFEVVASNEVGILDQPATIFVPGRNQMPKEPVAFTKIAFDDAEGLYELSWKSPVNGDNDIVNYTIFWCENDRDRPYQCQGYLEWIHVDKDSMVRNITVPDPHKVYQFAISANTKVASSGMMWASCTVIHNKVVGKMKTVWINRVVSSVIEVGWKLDCSDRIGIVEGFRIYYCPIMSPFNSNCKGPQFNTTIKADLNTIRGEITGLKPYTTYMIAVSVLTKSGEGQQSDPLYNTTMEATPSDPPRDVVVRDVTNTTMFVEWKEPLAMNGVLRYYVIHYNEHQIKVEATSVKLRGLMANSNYSIRVSACTVACSSESKPVYVLTNIGVPNKIQQPSWKYVNDSQVKLSWQQPQFAAGPLNYYQVMTNDGDIQNTTDESAIISIPDCDTMSKNNRVLGLQVRAVNIASTGEHLYGNWSEMAETNCRPPGPSIFVWVIIWIIGSICGIAFVFCVAYSSKRMWLKCKAMQDVEVKLPPGLAPNMKLLQKGDQHIRQSSADSSGCSSGQESVTSSLTSDSQISSDSGAEVDPVVSNKLIIDATTTSTTTSSPAWESSSLRQRNVASASKPSLDATARWDPYVKVGKGSNELIMPTAPTADSMSLARSTPNLSDAINFNASPQTWSSTGYISMPSSEEMSTNPSPVPKQAPAGSYSVVGVMNKSLPRCKSEEEAISLAKVEAAENKSTNVPPYVSLASLEQQTKENNPNKALDSLRVFDEFVDKSKQQPQSRPYVQAGILDPQRPPFDVTSRQELQMMNGQQQQTSPSFFAQAQLAKELAQKLIPTQSTSDSKPYVTVASVPEVIARKSAVIAPTMPVTLIKTEVPIPMATPTSSKSFITPYSMIGSKINGDINNTMVQPSNSMSHVMQQNKIVGLDDSGFRGLENSEKVGLYPSLDLEAQEDLSQSSTTTTSSANSAASAFRVCWQPNEAKPSDSSKSELSSVMTTPMTPMSQQPTTTPLPQFQATKTASGYVTLPEQQPLPSKFPARFAKPLQPTQQQQQQQSDEQYSKVAVNPRVVH